MEIYPDLLCHIMAGGTDRGGRTRTGARNVFGHQMRFDLAEGFPLLTTKRVHTRSVFGELLWFLRGDTNIVWLRENHIITQDEWTDENGNLGPIYSYQWHSWSIPGGWHVDQLASVIESLCSNPESRRYIVSAWSVADVDAMALPPCHALFQSYVADGRSNYQLYRRSVDVFLGVLLSIAPYVLLIYPTTQVARLDAGEFIHTFDDAHIYHNRSDQVTKQLTRQPRALPQLVLNPGIRKIDRFELSDITVESYNPHPAAKVPIVVQGAPFREAG